MEFSDGLAIAAIALALSGIFFGVLFYKWQSELARDMHGLLNKIEGLTTSTREQQQRQTETLINALADRQRTRAAVAAQDVTREGVGEIIQRLEGLEELLPATAADGATRVQVEELRARLDSLAEQVAAAVRQATTPASFRERLEEIYRGVGLAGDPPLGEPGKISLVFYPPEIAPGGEVRIAPSGWVPRGDFEDLRCAVSTPDGLTWESEVHQDLKWGSPPSIGFPSDFPGASTDVLGQYLVTVSRRERGSWKVTAGGAFYVSPPIGQHDD